MSIINWDLWQKLQPTRKIETKYKHKKMKIYEDQYWKPFFRGTIIGIFAGITVGWLMFVVFA
jgi:hypothetical protein